MGSPTKPPYCACHTAPVKGLPDYKWLTETNSCVDSPCHGPTANGKCATTFVGPNNMAASFNRTNWRLKGDVVSTDLRAFNNGGDSTLGTGAAEAWAKVHRDPPSPPSPSRVLSNLRCSSLSHLISYIYI